jgi:hypothetical protein
MPYLISDMPLDRAMVLENHSSSGQTVCCCLAHLLSRKYDTVLSSLAYPPARQPVALAFTPTGSAGDSAAPLRNEFCFNNPTGWPATLRSLSGTVSSPRRSILPENLILPTQN